MSKNDNYKANFWLSYEANEWIYMLIIIFIGLGLRWIGLDDRPFHHDESLHGIYGLYIYENPITGFYKYNALLHGPLLYNILPFIYDLFGVSKWSVRFLSAFLGSIIIFIPFLFRHLFHKNTILFLITCISLSPSLVYWSRFIRHDYLVIISMAFVLWGIFCIPYRYKIFPILIGTTLQFTTKENAYMTACIVLGYMIFEYLVSKFILKKNHNIFKTILQYLRKHPFYSLFAVIISIFIYIFLFSAGFKYPQGILDGLYRKSLSYWITQHQIERISGPFIFQTLILGWYEFYFILLTLIHVTYFYYKSRGIYLYSILSAMLLAIVLHISVETKLPQIFFLYKILKIKQLIDFYPFVFLIVHSINVTIFYLKENNRKMAFFGYLFFATWFSYSFVGEKVPWLAIYPLLTGFIFLAMHLETSLVLEKIISFKKIGLLSIFILLIFTLKTSISTNFSRSGLSSELISQVHTDKNYEDIILDIKNKMLRPLNKKSPHLLAYHAWPITWHLHGLSNYHHLQGNHPLEYFDYIFAPTNYQIKNKKLLKTHRKITIPFRSWWVPDYKNITWSNYFSYLFTHNPWSNTGSSNVNIYIRK